MNLKLCAAVAAALACSAPAFALNPTVTAGIAADHTLVAAGASAARDSFLTLLVNDVCTTGSFDMYRAGIADGSRGTTGADFRAYSCTVKAGYALEGSNIVVYYRSEGGS